MKVELINYSQIPFCDDRGVILPQKNLLEQIAFAARVSNPSNQNNDESAEKLVRYLIKHQHWSPLEMVNVCLEIETTRDIARQILRHRSFSFQEFSQRYADASQLGMEFKEARLQDTKNRQNSIEIGNQTTYDEIGGTMIPLKDAWEKEQKRIAELTGSVYKWAISNGIAKEQARAVLPEGMTVSRMYMNGTLRSWVHYIQLRSGVETQKEHREIALACANAIESIFPMIKEFVV
jgi:thymidylate synthase (FAD)